MSYFDLEGQTVFVLGLGKTGMAVVKALKEDGAKVLVWDEKDSSAIQKLYVTGDAIPSDPANTNWLEVVALVKSPGISMNHPAVLAAKSENVTILGDIDLLYRRCEYSSSFNGTKMPKFIGITGTNGKSTTTALIGHILKQNGYGVGIGGNIGTPALSLPDMCSTNNGNEGKENVYVLELSSYQLELMNEAVMDVAILLNLTPDHLERHGSMDGYLKVKKRIFNRQGVGSLQVVGIEDESLNAVATGLKSGAGTVVSITSNRRGGDESADVGVDENSVLWARNAEGGFDSICKLDTFPNIPGRHNWQNVAATFGALRNFVSDVEFVKALKTFVGLPHRLERVTSIGNVEFINDSKATNAESAIKALTSFKNIYWICGGQAKQGGVVPCLKHLQNVRAVFVIGESMNEFVAKLEHHIPTFACEKLITAVDAAYSSAKNEGVENAVVLLSPACASWDQFNSFEHRGDVFTNLCNELADRESGRIDELSKTAEKEKFSSGLGDFDEEV